MKFHLLRLDAKALSEFKNKSNYNWQPSFGKTECDWKLMNKWKIEVELARFFSAFYYCKPFIFVADKSRFFEVICNGKLNT